MIKVLTIFFLISATFSFKFNIFDWKPKKTVKNRLSPYLGKGYHLLKGNPFTDKIDEGFRAPIFDFSYQQNLTTDDGKYLIPDHTSSVESISCSLTAKCNSYSGTTKYQQQLSRIVEADTKLQTSFLDAAFSFSVEFDEFSSFSVSRNQTITQANAECSVYTIQMPLYTNEINLTEDFVDGVKQAHKLGDWRNFIEHFGTHFASKVVFGGRSVISHSYTQETMSFFESMGLDVNRAAQVQFLNKFSINLTNETKKYESQTKVVDVKVEAEKEAMLGGEPPQSGNWIDWQRTVRDNLAPISYHLTTLSTLFNFIHFIEVKEAIKNFQNFLNTYCSRETCPIIHPERPPPKPLNVSFHQMLQIHGQKYNPTTFDTLDQGVKIGMRVVHILMGSQGSLDSIQFFLSDGIIEHDLQVIGDREFNHQYSVPSNDEIKCIRFGITYNDPYWKFTSMQFVTKNGVSSDVFGGYFRINEYQVICLNDNDEHFVGFYGHYGSTFDSIGFNVMKEAFEN